MNNLNDINKTKSTFKDLIVWKKARELRIELSSFIKTFPKIEYYNLSNQIVRAARSVKNNFTEEYCRFHYQEKG